MSRRIEMLGRTFGLLTVVSTAPVCETDRKRRLRFLCECACGETCVVVGGSLRSGHTKSCGCLNRRGNPTHGHHNERLYGVWKTMKSRCRNPAVAGYENYGGRGIAVCEEWSADYSAFRDWALRTGYQEELTLDRRDNEKGYSAENCRWVSRTTQNRNQRPRKDSTTGMRGVKRLSSTEFSAVIYLNGTRVNLGVFDSLEAACEARADAERQYWGGDD